MNFRLFPCLLFASNEIANFRANYYANTALTIGRTCVSERNNSCTCLMKHAKTTLIEDPRSSIFGLDLLLSSIHV